MGDRIARRPLRWHEIVQGSVAGLLVVLLVAGALLAYRGGALAAVVGPTAPRAIIVIVPDALRADRLSCYGYDIDQSPHISALARDGVLYRNTNAQSSWTKPSVATILTSLYPPTHQARSYTDILPDDVVTLPEVLAVHDYHTVGFVTNYNLFPRFNFQQGFQDYYALDGVVSTWNRDGQKYYQEAELFNQSVLAWLEANHDQRFFMYLHYMDTHRPYWLHPYDGRSYYDEDPALLGPISDAYDGEIRYFDQQFGNLVAALKRLGLYDDALIILTSDHGEEFLEHDGWAHGKTLYQEVTNIPLIIKYPGGAGAGMTDAGMARSVDIATTILDVAGIPAPSIMEGVSLRQPPDAPARSQLSLSTTCQKGWSMAVRDSRYKLIEIIDGNPRGRAMTQLYDLVADPGETMNLAETHPDVLARLRATLSQMMALSEQAAVGSQEAVLDAEFQERLHQLGY